MGVYSGYDFNAIRNPILKALFETIFDIVSGHDHDGVNSKAVITGVPADDSITTAKIADGALSADAAGRAKMADSFVNAAKLAPDAVETAKIKDENVTPAKLSTNAKLHIFSYQVEDLGAGVDVADRVIFQAPAGADITLISAGIIPLGDAAGVDDGNPSVITLSDGTNTIVSKQYDSDPAFPAAGAFADLGALDEIHKVLTAGEKLHLVITNGATANIPGLMLQIAYTIADAA